MPFSSLPRAPFPWGGAGDPRVGDDPNNPAREPLLWQNALFGKRTRRRVWARRGFGAINSPLFLNPDLLDEVEKYVLLPKEVKTAYREAAKKKPPTI